MGTAQGQPEGEDGTVRTGLRSGERRGLLRGGGKLR